MRKQFADLDLTYSIGGQISFDVFPKVMDAAMQEDRLTGIPYSELEHFEAVGHDKTCETSEIRPDSYLVE